VRQTRRDPNRLGAARLLETDRAEVVPEPLTARNPEHAKHLDGMFGAVRKRTVFYRGITVGSAVETPKPERLFDPDSA
jgi:hypothetical protein